VTVEKSFRKFYCGLAADWTGARVVQPREIPKDLVRRGIRLQRRERKMDELSASKPCGESRADNRIGAVGR
jgi:hypothetical protein